MAELPASWDDALREAVAPHFPSRLEPTEDGRVRVVCSAHVLPASADAVAKHVQGKKFQRLVQQHATRDGLVEEYKPYLVVSRRDPSKLFCRVTGRLLQATEAAVVAHSEGKAFNTGLEKLQQGLKLIREPDPSYVAPAERDEQKPKEKKPKEKRKEADDDDDEEPECWVPPDHVIDSDLTPPEESDDEDDEGEDEDDFWAAPTESRDEVPGGSRAAGGEPGKGKRKRKAGGAPKEAAKARRGGGEE